MSSASHLTLLANLDRGAIIRAYYLEIWGVVRTAIASAVAPIIVIIVAYRDQLPTIETGTALAAISAAMVLVAGIVAIQVYSRRAAISRDIDMTASANLRAIGEIDPEAAARSKEISSKKLIQEALSGKKSD